MAGAPMEEGIPMLFRVRCDHCEALLDDERLERDRKRFCCIECARAFDRGELKAISPHDHAAPRVRQSAGVR